MRVCYNKLWKLLIDLKMRRVDLRDCSHISTCSLAKLGKDENVSMEVLKKICKTLQCNIGDIMDILPDENEENAKNLEQTASVDTKCTHSGDMVINNKSKSMRDGK